jgi:SnoaL-like domain
MAEGGTGMAADSTTYVAKYLRAIEAFNNGDLTTFGDLLSDDCTFDGTAGRVGTSRDEIVKGLQQGRDAGWLSHNPIGTAAAGEFLVTVYENKFSDGSRVTAAGCLRFNDDGKVTEIRSLDPR